MKRFWAIFFIFWPLLALYVCVKAPDWKYWFPTTINADGHADSPLGQRIDGLFYMILYITTAVFIATQAALGYVLWKSSKREEEDVDDAGAPRKAWFSHGSHNLEVIWTIVPAGVLLFIALYQMDVWAEYRIKDAFPERIKTGLAKVGINPNVEVPGENGKPPVKMEREAMAEVTARQFEWRIRYPGFGPDGKLLALMPTPQPTDLYTVNDLHLPSREPVMIELRTQDVQHSFFVPELRVKQDAVPGLVIPIWFQAEKSTTYSLTCAELCGWGHYKMKARVVTHPPEEFVEFLRGLAREQFEDGFEERKD